MDDLRTPIKGLERLYRFSKSIIAHERESESLSMRLRWDLSILNGLLESLNTLKQSRGQLNDKDIKLWEESAHYLQGLSE
jgi:hypothetical protein